MTPPRDPDEVEQTLDPETSAKSDVTRKEKPASDAPSESTATDNTPAAGVNGTEIVPPTDSDRTGEKGFAPIPLTPEVGEKTGRIAASTEPPAPAPPGSIRLKTAKGKITVPIVIGRSSPPAAAAPVVPAPAPTATAPLPMPVDETLAPPVGPPPSRTIQLRASGGKITIPMVGAGAPVIPAPPAGTAGPPAAPTPSDTIATSFATAPVPAPIPAPAPVAPVSEPALGDVSATLPASQLPRLFPNPAAFRKAPSSAEFDLGADPTIVPTSAPTSAPGPRPGPVPAADPDDTGTDTAATLQPRPARGPDTVPGSVASGPAPSSASPSATGTMVGRFALKDLHAAGGLGEVFLARDTELNREVAVKRIKSQYADDPGSRSRFLSEATLTARLDHPGVVPVFGLVNDVRGRPCYAMRFIRGETLKDEIDRYHGARSSAAAEKTQGTGATAGTAAAPAEPAEPAVPRSVAFRHLLGRFIATCQAIAYAHKKNIIHRDIKPANIMVGSFGETLVVDWGLAKSLDDGPDLNRILKAQSEAGFRHDPEATDIPTHATRAGTAVGTPAYMAPEQAAGDVEKVGPRADVYALGATLFVILTGKSPVGGKTTAEVLDNVRRGAYQSAVAVNPQCPKPLDAIARKAMALRPEDRYATALELAADVEQWLSDEPVSCYRDPLPERLARWARRNPARVATAVSVLLVGLIAAGGIAWAVNEGRKQKAEEQRKTAEQRDRAEDQEKKTAAALVEVQKQRDAVVEQEKKTEQQRARAVALGGVATKRYEKAVAAYNLLVNGIAKKLGDKMGMQDIRRDVLLRATDGLSTLLKDEGNVGADRTLVAAYRQMGEVYQLLGETAKARVNLKLAVDKALLVRGEAAPNEFRAADLDLGRSLDKYAGVLVEAGNSEEALTKIDEAIKLFGVYAADPTDTEAQKDLAAARVRRAKIKMEQGDTRGAQDEAAKALAVRRKLAPPKLAPGASAADVEMARALADSLDETAGLQLRTGQSGAALASARESLDIRKTLAGMFSDHPDAPRERAEAHARVGEILFERGQVTAAVAEFRSGLEALAELVKADEDNAGAKADLALMRGRLGHAQLRLGEVESALNHTEAGLAAALKLREADPASAKARRDLAVAHTLYGEALLAAKRLGDALGQFEAGEKILRPLREEDRASVRTQLELARGLERVGDARTAKSDPNRALEAFAESVKLREEVAALDIGSAAAKRDLALGLHKLAAAYCDATQPAKAEPFASRATDIFVALAVADPTSAQAQRDVALAYGNWGQVLIAGGRTTGALIVWQNSLERCEQLVKVDQNNTQAKEDEAAAWERLASFYAATRHPTRARAAATIAVQKWTAIADGVDVKTKAGRQRLALAMLRCGDVHTEVRQFRDAAKWYEKAAAEAKSEPNDLLLAPVAKQVRERMEYMRAVESGLTNVRSVLTYAPEVQVPALKTIGALGLQTGDPTTSYVAALQLAKIAKTPADKFAAARVLAGCAGSRAAGDKVKGEYAQEAVAQLKVAIAAGFRDADALAEPEWDAVRLRAKAALAAVQKELEKLNEGK
jgi:serine/threonine protein kinase